MPLQGRILGGRYRLERQLGQGGMGSVWLAEHLALRSQVAVKLMDPAIAANPEGAERFRREAHAAASLRSTHVVQVLDYGLDEAGPFLVMELLQGESLADHLQRVGRLAPERTVSILTQVGRAVARAHAAKIVHRDLKPDNIFLVREDDQEIVKVLDFGIAKTVGSGAVGPMTRTGATMGTPYYMSPEQAEGKKTVDHRTDLWAMGVIACECMTGAQPFGGQTLGEIILKICVRPTPVPSSLAPVPPGFDGWFAKATNRDPDQRFQSAGELADELRDALTGGGRRMLLGGSAPGAGAYAPTALASRAPTAEEHPALPAKRVGRLVLASIGGALAVGAAVTAAVALRAGQVSHEESAPGASAASSEPSASSNPPSPDAGLPALLRGAPPSLWQPPGSRGEPIVDRRARAPGSMSAGPDAVGSKVAPADSTAPSVSSENGQEDNRAPALQEPAATAKSPAALSCYSDPFTGVVRLVGVGSSPAGAHVFACKQNPFTGAYQRL